MAQIVPFCAILCHFLVFCKENLHLNRQPLCFHHFAKPWPLTSRPAGFASIPAPDPNVAENSGARLGAPTVREGLLAASTRLIRQQPRSPDML